MAVLHDDQRVDLQQAHILLGEGLVERREQRFAIASDLAGSSSLSDCASSMAFMSS
jgi:hypothetical protein